jgi:thioredoxin 2
MAGSGTIVTCPNCATRNRVAPTPQGVPQCSVCHTQLPWIVEATAETFDQEITSSQPVLVDFWAPWCGPCVGMAPQFDSAARQLKGRAILAKVNSDDSPQLSSRFGIRSIPTLVRLDRGREQSRQSGALQANQIVSLVR